MGTNLPDSIIAIVFEVIVAILPVILILIYKGFTPEELKQREDQIGAFYEEIDVHSFKKLLYMVFYLLRRLLLVALAIFAADYPFAQILAMTLHSILMLAYLFYV